MNTREGIYDDIPINRQRVRKNTKPRLIQNLLSKGNTLKFNDPDKYKKQELQAMTAKMSIPIVFKNNAS